MNALLSKDVGCIAGLPANDNWSGMDTTAVRQWFGSPAPAMPRVSLATLPAPTPVLAISGPAGSGKSTLSTYLSRRYGYHLVKFADPLKNMCRAIGMTDAMIEGDQKEVPQDLLSGKTPRHVMQTLGTEWGRGCIDPDFWVSLWQRRAEKIMPVVVDDCRFGNEAAAVRRLGGRVLRLVGRGGISGAHESERQDFIADEVIINDGTVADLHKQAVDVIEGWM